MKKYAIEIKWGLIFSISIMIWMLAERLLGLHDEHISKHAIYTNIFGVVAVGLYILALYQKRKHYYDGVMTWKQGFLSGFVLTMVITALTPLTQYIISLWIAPDYFENMITYSIEIGERTREDAEAFFNLESYILQSTVFALISGLVTAAIVALILRKRAPKISI